MLCKVEREKKRVLQVVDYFMYSMGKKVASSFQSKLCLEYFRGKQEEIIIIISELA